MDKLFDLIALFRKGSEVANKGAWKDGGNAATLLAPLLMAIVKLLGDFGIGVQLSVQDATTIALGIVAIVQFVIHNISSKDAGLLPAAKQPSGASNNVSAQTVSAKAAEVVQPVSQSNKQTPVSDSFDADCYRG